MNRRMKKMMFINSTLLLMLFMMLIMMPQPTESCLPSWFRQERSAEPLESIGGGATIQGKIEETNEIREIDENEIGKDEAELQTTTNLSIFDEKTTEILGVVMKKEKEENEIIREKVEEFVSAEAEYAYEYVDEEAEKEVEEELKYNENATMATSTLKPELELEMEKVKEQKCKNYCHHNATCHVELNFNEDGHVSAIVPSCHCPPGWEGTRCDRHYFQALYAPVSGRYNNKKPSGHHGILPPSDLPTTTNAPSLADFHRYFWRSPTSAIPAFSFLIIMLLMFVAIVTYAYRRMSQRTDETTYTMSHMCPPEAFTVLKTPNGRKISICQETMMSVMGQNSNVTPTQRVPIRSAAIRTNENQRNNFFSILRSQGTIPSRSINEDDTPKHFKSVPRVEVSAINYSGHIDFSTMSYPEDSSLSSTASPSRPHRTVPPVSHVAIQMDDLDIDISTKPRSTSRADGEPSTPTTSEPMILPR